MRKNDILIIEIPYGGLGDHLFHSHLPRIAKETGKYNKVFISDKSLFRHLDNKYLVWELNPFVDGFTEERGQSCKIEEIVKKTSCANTVENNLLDEVMLAYGLDDGKRWHEPEIYYKPKYIRDYSLSIFDPNFLSWIGDAKKEDMMYTLKKHNFTIDAVMKIRTPKALYISKTDDRFINTPSLRDFCNLIYSCKEIFCLTSGTATLAASMGKSATVFYGKNQGMAFQHSKLHTYILIEKCTMNKILDLVKAPVRFLKRKLFNVK